MREFILVKGKSRNRLLRVDRIIDVEDTEEGAVINYRRFGEDSVFPLKTGSTAAEVLAAIEGAQEFALRAEESNEAEGEMVFACICVHPGDHSYCPVHGI